MNGSRERWVGARVDLSEVSEMTFDGNTEIDDCDET